MLRFSWVVHIQDMASVATPPPPLSLSLSLCVSVYMFNTLLNMWPGPEILLMPVVIPSRVAQTQVGGEGVSHMQKSHKFSCLCARLILVLFSHIFLNCCAQDISVCVAVCVWLASCLRYLQPFVVLAFRLHVSAHKSLSWKCSLRCTRNTHRHTHAHHTHTHSTHTSTHSLWHTHLPSCAPELRALIAAAAARVGWAPQRRGIVLERSEVGGACKIIGPAQLNLNALHYVCAINIYKF